MATAGLLAAGTLLVGIFVVVDWRVHAAVLPSSVFRFWTVEMDLT